MKTLFYLIAIGAAAYAFVNYAPDGATHRALAAVGLSDFFENKAPAYLRDKLRIPANPVEKRKKLIDQLSQSLILAERELEAVVPASPTGTPVPLAEIPGKAEIRNRIEAVRESLARSDAALKEIEKANAGQGIFQKTAERILDKILPPPAANTACSDSQ